MFVMLSSEEQKAVRSRQKAEVFSAFVGVARRQQIFFCLLLSAFCLLATACRRDMQDQPKTIAYRESSFYKDGTGSRPLIDGTVPRGYLREDREYYLGKKAITASQSGTSMTQLTGAQATAPSITVPSAQPSET